MKQISAFQCAYCTKIYLSKDSCRRHEKKCFWNEDTKSCASCIFERYREYKISQGHSTSIRTCLQNHDITRKLRTGCPDHHYKKAKCNLHQMQKIRSEYDPELFVKPLLEKYNAEIERRYEVQKLIDEQSHIFRAEAMQISHEVDELSETPF